MGAVEPDFGREAKPARRFAVGAEVQPSGGAHFRVWAPASGEVELLLGEPGDLKLERPRVYALRQEAGGYAELLVAEAKPGMLYKYRLGSGSYPDPASRFQPQGPHGPSELIDSSRFSWTDAAWRGLWREGQVVYEMHIGTFTHEGSWAAATRELPALADLGITVLEVMPVADFPGRFGWGYDGVNLFAPSRLYGAPDDFRAFVDRAHALGLGVVLDVVYNHFGPDGCYLQHFSPDYFSKRYKNEWGEPVNFDAENSGPVREFFIANSAYWASEFHLDGLRLDATQQIFDSSSEHIIAAVVHAFREAAAPRQVWLVGENEPQECRLIRTPQNGGYGLDALWNDDLHHSAVTALTGRNEAYYMDYRGTPQEFVSAMKYGYLYQGQWYAWQKKCRGTPALGIQPAQFVNFIENHDQVANSLRGLRIHQLTSPGRFRAMTALILLGPGTPMLFQGQEFAASTPFLYFADHRPELSKLVAKGRGEFLCQFPSIAAEECKALLADPAAPETFERSKLRWEERQEHAWCWNLHRDLLKLRREDPVLGHQNSGTLDGATLGPEAFVLRYFAEDGQDRLLIVNLGLDLLMRPMPEPLLAPPEGRGWLVRWSSEHPAYGGCGTREVTGDDNWVVPGHSAILLVPGAVRGPSRRCQNEWVKT